MLQKDFVIWFLGGGKYEVRDVKQMIKYLLNIRRYLKNIYGSNSISFYSYIRYGVSMRNCKIGKYCYIGENSALNHVTVGNYSSIAPSVMIGGMEHSYWGASTSPRITDSCISTEETIIGHDVWIGAQCFVKQGVTIGDGAVIGAQSLVIKDVPPYSIVFGSPSKLYKYRFSESTIKTINKSSYWNYSPRKARLILSKINLNEEIHESC